MDKVYVYTPSFPEQTIATKPVLLIDLPRSRAQIRGFLDPSRPHAVNHLIVGDIGDEEVVVVACDDGDVISYTVRSISLAIDEGTETVFEINPYESQKFDRDRQSAWANLILPVIDPHKTPGFRIIAAWFHENVGASAWGLATHKASRLLAVSSNAKEINVFAPSLSQNRNGAFRSTCPPLERIERYQPCKARNPVAWKDRSSGKKFTLLGHAANIPNIAFCDNILDPEGRYLASTDIDGYTIVWDMSSGTQIETLGNTGPRKSIIAPASRYFTHGSDARGWAVACLDPRTSRLRYVV